MSVRRHQSVTRAAGGPMSQATRWKTVAVRKAAPYQLSFCVSLATCISTPSFSATHQALSLGQQLQLHSMIAAKVWRCCRTLVCPPGGDGLAEYSPRSAMFITPGALELVRFLAGSLLVSLGDMVRPLTAESTWEISDVSADMVAVL